MTELSKTDREEREDLAEAGQAFARYLKSKGLGDVVRQIGRIHGEGALRIAIATFAQARDRRNRNKGYDDEDFIPW